MKRRNILKAGICGLAAATGAGALPLPLSRRSGEAQAAVVVGPIPPPQPDPVTSVEMVIEPFVKEMVDTRLVNHWGFRAIRLGGVDVTATYAHAQAPGIILSGVTGQTFTVTLTNLHVNPDNGLGISHGFRIAQQLTTLGVDPGGCVPLTVSGGGVTDTVVLAPNETKTFSFTVPPGGSYYYFDPLNAPVNRVMGLHGAFVALPDVMPASPYSAAPGSAYTPYSNPTPAVQQLFDDLGYACDPADSVTRISVSGANHFPGDRWDPRRSWVWMFSASDPVTQMQAQEKAADGEDMNALAFSTNFRTRYFHINGKSGYWSSSDPDIAVWGNCGMPDLVRMMNAAPYYFSPHMHGNHCYTVFDSARGGVQSQPWWLDVWSLWEGQIVEFLNPFIIPPDINLWPPSPNRIKSGASFSQFPLQYPMHCHNEMSQTAAGGNYPGGAVIHWSILSGGIGARALTDNTRSDYWLGNPTRRFMVDERVFWDGDQQFDPQIQDIANLP